MRGWVMRQGLMAGFLVASAALVGCDSDSFAPPPSGKGRSSSSASGAMPVRAREIVMVLPAAENNELALYDLIGRNESGLLKVVYRSLKPSPGDGPSKQAELIRQAAAEGASALVVVPESTKETAEALAAIDPKKTPVVLLGRAPAGGVPASTTRVAFQGFDASARALVEALVEAEKPFGLKPDAQAVLLTVAPPDESAADRDAALVAALKAAKVPLAATVAVSADSAAAEKALTDAVKAHPEVGLVVCDDEVGLTAVNAMHRALPEKKYLAAGYYTGRNNAPNFMQGNVPALAERSIESLVRRAFRAAVDRAEGREAPEKVAIEVPVRRGNVVAGQAGSPSPTPKEPDGRKSAPPDPKPAPPDVKKAAPAEAKKGA